MSEKSNNKKIIGEMKKWRTPWIIGTISMVIYMIYEINLFHLYLYFFLVALVTLVSEWGGWGEIRDDELIVRFGILNFMKISLNYSDIDTIEEYNETKNWFARLGGWGATYTNDKIERKIIRIRFNRSIPASILRKEKILKLNSLFGQMIEVSKEINRIDIYKKPPCGISDFMHKLDMLCGNKLTVIYNNSENSNINESEKNTKKFKFYDFILFLLPLLFLFLLK